MAKDAPLTGLYVGADQEVVYTDEDEPPTDMTGWTIVLDIRKTDVSLDPPLLTATGVVSGAYANTQATNHQIVTFLLPKAKLAATIFKGDDPAMRYSIKRTDPGVELPLRYGDAPLIRVTQV